TEAVNVTGNPKLTLAMTPVNETATYSSGSGSNTLTFTYTIQAGDTTAALDYPATNSLALNGGTIARPARNNPPTPLPPPAPNPSNSIRGNASVVIDTTAPTITAITSTTANGYYKAGASIGVTFTFSETVTVTGVPKLVLNTAPVETVSYASGSGTTAVT